MLRTYRKRGNRAKSSKSSPRNAVPPDLTRHDIILALAPITERIFSSELLGRLRGVRIPGVDLSGLNLSGIDLSWADLRGCNFAKAFLLNTDFADSDLQGANFTGATFENIFADAPGTKFNKANLKGANFTHAAGGECDFESADLSGAIFTDANMRGANFRHAILDGTVFERTSLDGSHFFRDEISRTKFVGVDIAKLDIVDRTAEEIEGEASDKTSHLREPQNEADAIVTARRLLAFHERIGVIAREVEVEDSEEWEGCAVDSLFHAQQILMRAAARLAHHFDLHVAIGEQPAQENPILFEELDGKAIPVPRHRADGSRRDPDGKTIFTLQQAVEKFGLPAEQLTAIHAAIYEPPKPESAVVASETPAA